jgi:predicted alpha/beta hydrolase
MVIPAMGTGSSFYQPFAEELVNRGFSVLVSEIPGTGESRPRLSAKLDYGYRDLVEVYLPAMINRAKEVGGDIPVLLIGHSLGAHVGALAVLTGRIEIDALVTVAGGNINHRNWTGAGKVKVMLAGIVFSVMSRLFGYLPGQYVGFGCGQARTLIQEWARVISTGNYSHIYQDMAAGTSAPTLCLGFEGDHLCPEKSVADLASLLDGEIMTLDAAKESNPHSSWARSPVECIAAIERWLEGRGLVSGG